MQVLEGNSYSCCVYLRGSQTTATEHCNPGGFYSIVKLTPIVTVYDKVQALLMLKTQLGTQACSAG